MSDGRLVGEDPVTGEYVAIGDPWDHDLLAFLGGGSDAVAEATRAMRAANRTKIGPPTGLPFLPRSLRAFALWESHMVGAARGFVNHFPPARIRGVVNGFERTTGRTFPALRPRRNYYRYPQFYFGTTARSWATGTS